MSEPVPGLLDSTRLLFDLRRANEIAQCFSGQLEPEVIARCVTDGLVEKFDCAFARIWLLQSDQAVLRLVASSGMYTHTNGSFARVPMGAYKVGKIAQNRVSFLSNNLSDETWVRDRDWAIANNIRGFAGYPLTIQNRVIGVLATFSHHAMAPEFLEVLQTLCATVSVALDTALQYQKERQAWQASAHSTVLSELSLSDQLAGILSAAHLTLIGTEQPLGLPLAYVFLRAAEALNRMGCTYCRLIYSSESVAIEAIIMVPELEFQAQEDWIQSSLGDLFFTIGCLGGVFQTQMEINQKAIQVLLKLPYANCTLGCRLRIQCGLPVLQMAFTHLSYLAGLIVCNTADPEIPVLTDDITQIQPAQRVIWLKREARTLPKGIQVSVDLSIQPEQLREAVGAVMRGEAWRIESKAEGQQPLSERELEIISLLAQGLRDRDVASSLFITESTVKFHLNNVLSKLKARTRFQALHQAMVNGWIQ